MREGGEDLFCAAEGFDLFSWWLLVLYPGEEGVESDRTTSIPLSSEALSSRTIWRMFLLP